PASTRQDRFPGSTPIRPGVMHGFLLNQGQFTILNFPGATATQAFGLNNQRQVGGSYTDSAGLIHGFIWTKGVFQRPVDDPNGPGATIINGINGARHVADCCRLPDTPPS